MSTRDVLRKAKPRVHQIEISAGSVYIRALSGIGRAAYVDLVSKHRPGSPPLHEIAALALCEEDGAIAYDSKNEKDLAELADVDGADLQKIVLALFDFSGLSTSADGDAEKKSEASPS